MYKSFLMSAPVRYSIQTLYCQTVGRVHSVSPVHSFLGISVHSFIHSSILPSIYTQSDVSQRFSRALSILMRRLLQLFAFPDMALCSLFTCTVCWLLITRVCYTSIHWHQRWQHWACFVDPSL